MTLPTNHNGGPLERRMTDKEFRSFVRIIVLSRLPGNQKLLTIGAAVMSDDNGEATLGAEDMKRICSVSKRDTVFAAKRAIAEDGLGLVSTVTTFGRSNRYRVMPPAVLNSIIEAYNSRTTNIVDVPKSGTTPVPKKGTSTHPEKGDATRPEKGTGPIPQNGTSPERGDGSRAPTRAHLEPPSGVVSPLDFKPDREVGDLNSAPTRDVPHMNGVGFVISKRHNIVVDRETVEGWRQRFPAIPDLEAQLEKLSSVILKGGHSHPAWTCPEGWLAGCLAQDNARAINANKPKPKKISRFG